jgi:hypothetical protein
MSRKIFAIVTHHSDREDAAEAWKEDGVAAIGWSSAGNLTKIDDYDKLSQKLRNSGRGASSLWVFKEMKKGDLVLAYVTKNIIAYVGEIAGGYEYNKKNKVGMDTKQGGFGYRHQRRVKWWTAPRYFSRKELPWEMARQLGIQGRIIAEVNPGRLGFEGLRNFLRDNAKRLSDSGLEINEDTIKAGIRKYLHNYLSNLEKGLKIVQAERGVSDQKRPDFLARDQNGNLVLIECKGTAQEDAAWQVKNYLNKFKKKEGTRAILVAFKITPECKEVAQRHNIELYECDLTFDKS